MNLLLLLAAAWSLATRATYGHLWSLLLALCAFSLEMQVVTVVAIGDYRTVTAINVGIFLLTQLFPRCRSALVASCRDVAAGLTDAAHRLRAAVGTAPSCSVRLILCLLPIPVLLVGLRGVLYLPESADPYHLMKVFQIERTGSLEYFDVLDHKINDLSFFYELLLVDLKAIPLVGEALLRISGLLLLLSYLGLILGRLARSETSVQALSLWGCLFFVPVFYPHFLLIKNDYIVFLFAFAALGFIYSSTPGTPVRQYVLMGLLAGLTLSLKSTTFPIVIALALFLPYGSARRILHSRISAAVGVLAGVISGGLVFTWLSNLATYGDVLGPMRYTGNLVSSPSGSVVSLGRFLMSLADLGLLTPVVWPSRGGWGGNLGILFLGLLAIQVWLVASRQQSGRLLALCLTCFVPFGATYPDADLAHRMVLAPAFLLMTETVRQVIARARPAGGLDLSSRMIVGLALVSFLVVMRIGAGHLSQIQYLSFPEWALGLQHTVGSPLVPDLSTRPAWRMRQINREARRHTRIASAVQENRLLLDGTDYEQIYLTTMAHGERAQRVWNTSRLETFDYFIVHPQHVADNDALSARLSACDTQPLSQSVHGPDDVIGISPCANDL